MCNLKNKKREKILEAAYKLFAEKGYNNTKILEIAKAAGIGKGTVYEYFESKESLLLDVFSLGINDYLENCRNVINSEKSQKEKLVTIIRLELKHCEENGIRMVKMSELILDANDGMPTNFIKKMHELWKLKYSIINEILVAGIEKGEFKKMNTDLATIAVIGTTDAYLKVKYRLGRLDIAIPFESDCLNEDELFEFILRRITD